MQDICVSGQATSEFDAALTEPEDKPNSCSVGGAAESAPAGSDDSGDWRVQMRRRIRTFPALLRALPGLRKAESIVPVLAVYPMAISPYYLSLVRDADPSDPVFRQCVPQPEELHSPLYCRADPLHEEQHSPVPHLIHRYEDRALTLASSTCAMYCRHCTRKRIAGVREGCISRSAVERQCDYLRQHPGIREIIISGGDPLTMATERLDWILQAFRSVPTIRNIRIGTRVPVTLPMRITGELCTMLQKHHPAWLCTQFNHPREVTPEAAAACERLLLAGVPILNQTVLLKGVNDSAETMMELCRALQDIRVKPYYLYQCDLVKGVEHFRTPLATGIEIAETLRNRMSGIGVPQFTVDAPDGGGKIPISPNRVVGMEPNHVLLRNREGRIISCPEPEIPADDAGAKKVAARAAGSGCRVALVFNLKKVPLTVSDRDAEYDSRETVDVIAGSIESLGHTVIRIEANADLPCALLAAGADLVFNIAESRGSRGREGHVPALCELMGFPYTGSDQTTLAVALDKALAKTVLMQNGVATPRFRLARSVEEARDLDLAYPVIVKPNHEGSSIGVLPDSVAQTREDVLRLVERILVRYSQPAIVEECLQGAEFTAGFIGAGEPEALPLLEIQFLDPARPPIYDIELKQDPPDQVRHICPSRVPTALSEEIIALARRAYHALSCRDIGRVDVRLDGNGRPQVLEVNPLPGLAPRYSDVCKMTEALGWTHPELISELMAPALKRMAAVADGSRA